MTIQHTNEKFGDTENVDLNEEKFENFSQEEDESLDIIITKKPVPQTPRGVLAE